MQVKPPFSFDQMGVRHCHGASASACWFAPNICHRCHGGGGSFGRPERQNQNVMAGQPAFRRWLVAGVHSGLPEIGNQNMTAEQSVLRFASGVRLLPGKSIFGPSALLRDFNRNPPHREDDCRRHELQ
jgi:hypothetical protein